MGKSKLTINDIAGRLNLSKSTVSRALSENSDINPETRKKVLAMMEETGFKPNLLARSLKSGKTGLIGVIVPAYNIPFYSIAISGIQDYAAQNGYNILICHSNEKTEVEKENIDSLISSRVDGIIISVAKDHDRNEHIHKLKSSGIPLVMFNRVVEDIKAAKVVVNDYYGALNMTKFLIPKVKSKILYLSGPSNLLISLNRKMGFLDAIKDADLSSDHYEIIEGDFSSTDGYSKIREQLKKGNNFDTVFCVCDAVAYGAIKAIKEFNYKIPGDIAVAGFTNEPMTEYVDPRLTTVKQPIYEIGTNAAKLLISQIQNPSLPAEFCVLDTEILVRDSTRS